VSSFFVGGARGILEYASILKIPSHQSAPSKSHIRQTHHRGGDCGRGGRLQSWDDFPRWNFRFPGSAIDDEDRVASVSALAQRSDTEACRRGSRPGCARALELCGAVLGPRQRPARRRCRCCCLPLPRAGVGPAPLRSRPAQQQQQPSCQRDAQACEPSAAVAALRLPRLQLPPRTTRRRARAMRPARETALSATSPPPRVPCPEGSAAEAALEYHSSAEGRDLGTEGPRPPGTGSPAQTARAGPTGPRPSCTRRGRTAQRRGVCVGGGAHRSADAGGGGPHERVLGEAAEAELVEAPQLVLRARIAARQGGGGGWRQASPCKPGLARLTRALQESGSTPLRPPRLDARLPLSRKHTPRLKGATAVPWAAARLYHTTASDALMASAAVVQRRAPVRLRHRVARRRRRLGGRSPRECRPT